MPNEVQTLTPEQQAVQAVRATMQRIDEVLAKSGHPMYKDENGGGQPDALADQATADLPPQDGAPAAEPPMDGGGEPAPAPAPGGEPPAEPGMEPGADRAGMEAELADLGDDELSMLMEAAQAEMEKRQAAGQPGEGAPQAGGEGGAPMEMSMKKEFSSLAKSMETMAKAVESLAKSQEATSKEIASLRKSQPAAPARPTAQPTRAAATRGASPQVQVLEKSTPTAAQPQALSKSELITWAEGNMRDKNHRHPAVGTDMIATIMATPDEDLGKYQAGLRKQGVPLPTA